MSAWSKSPQIRQDRRWSVRSAGFSHERSGCGKFDLRGSQDFDWLRRTPFLDSFRVPGHSRTGRETSHWLVYQTRPQCRRKPCIGRPRTIPPMISGRDPGSPIRQDDEGANDSHSPVTPDSGKQGSTHQHEA